MPTLHAAASPVDWPRVEWVLLDMDGTVLDLAFDNHFWYHLLPERYARAHDLSDHAAWAELEPLFSGERGKLNWYCLDWWSARTGLDLVALKREARDRIRPLDGALEFLEAVRASGRRLWLVTNAHGASLRLKMEQTGLAGCFDTLVCSHDFGAPKEDALFWERLRARHAFEPARSLFVDDSLSVLRAARREGIAQVVASIRPDGTQPARPVYEFPGVDRLDALLPLPAFESSAPPRRA
jgi:haloacid dehalogenase superfamily, subfamily IA, variant 3 with third motif having DD or ED